MDKKISLARQEEERRSVLLADTGTGVAKEESFRGDKRTKAYRDAKRNEGKKAGNSPAESKSDAETAGDGRKRKPGSKRGYYNPFRKSVRGPEGGNRDSGRCAKELGIEWLDARCELSPSKAHHLISRTLVDEGVMFECKYCHKIKWLPLSFDECYRLGEWLHIFGHDTGYQMMLDEHPAARRLLVKIQDIYYLKKAVSEELFPRVMAAVVADKSYPYDIEVIEEEMP